MSNFVYERSILVRVRIAPSPTGDPHIGTAYMALFNYAYAQKHQGEFIIRIEDTDRTRFRKNAEKELLECLHWLGITWSEGPDKGGPYGPYHQSQRLEIYQKHMDILLQEKKAYRCFCSSQRLEELRKSQMAQKIPPGYDRRCRDLPFEESEKRKQEPHTIRLKVPLTGKISFHDGLRGLIEFDAHGIDDQILMKSDGFPTYHFANVVDDHLMMISHVVRGEEWISSTPKHILLYQAFGWDIPEFTHLPLLRNTDKSKISKRKNPTSISYFKKRGILPEALLNFLALMGWSYGENQEIFSLSEMIKRFDLKDINLGGPIFDLEKLSWVNSQYLKKMSPEELVSKIQQELFSSEYLLQVIHLIRERMEKFEDFIPLTHYFFSGDINYTNVPLKNPDNVKTLKILQDITDILESLESWDEPTLNSSIEGYLTQNQLTRKDVYPLMRFAIMGVPDSPPIFSCLSILGKEIVKRRIRLAIDFLKKRK